MPEDVWGLASGAGLLGLVATLLLQGVLGRLVTLPQQRDIDPALVLLPFYLAVSAVYGLLAAATNSTLPGMALHAGGNVFSALGLLLGGRSEWQLTAAPPPTVWQTGVDAAFAANLGAVAVAAAASSIAYRALFRAAPTSRPSE